MFVHEILHPEDMLEKHTLWSQILTELKSDQLEAQSKSCRWNGEDKQSTTANKEGSGKRYSLTLQRSLQNGLLGEI
jgi:hypothetical protein